MVAISIPGIPGYCQYLSIPHAHITAAVSAASAGQCRIDQSEERMGTLTNQMPARCGPWDHCQHGQHFQSPEFFLIQDKTWVWVCGYSVDVVCFTFFFTRKIYLVNCNSISNQLNEAFPYHDCQLTVKSKGCFRPCCGCVSEMDEAANVDWCCFKTLFI